jgi:drug/metabolite transporter (DMT)-like permease
MNILLYSLSAGIWGSTWLAITYQFGVVSVDVSVFYRFALASFLLFIWCFYKRLNLKFSLKSHLFFGFQGLFLFSLNYLASYEACRYVPSGLIAVGTSTFLIFNIINLRIFYKIPLSWPVFVGTLSGIIGIINIFWVSIFTLDLTNESLFGIILGLCGTLLASFGNMIAMRNQKMNISVLESNAYGMGYGALWMLGFLFLRGSSFQFDFSSAYILSLLYLSIFGSIIAFWCYLTLLGRIGASKAGYALILSPVIALCISTVFEGLVWDFRTFVGVGLILFGNVIILARESIKVPLFTKVTAETNPAQL